MNLDWRVPAAIACLALALAVPRAARPAPGGDGPVASTLLDKARPIAAALATATPVERAVWAEVWTKAGRVAEAVESAATGDLVVSDTRTLRAFLVAALDIGWKRIAGVNRDRFPGLKPAVEAFLADPEVIGRDDVAIDDAVRAKWRAACQAVAWAGVPRG